MMASVEIHVEVIDGDDRRSGDLIITPSTVPTGRGELCLSLRFSGISMRVDPEELERGVRAARILAERDTRPA